MSLPHQSIATTDNIEFINLSPVDVNPLISKCEIKVFYLGKNRNGSFISEDTARSMAETLRGAPIVGYYSQEKQDFKDHGQKITLDGDGVHFECLTKPYGFVAPDAKVWFQDFQEQDDFGETVTRTYLLTEGYLWTGQFPQVEKVLQGEGKPQSMELDEESLEGHWTEDVNSGREYFIINDAIISKLCILGDDVEPCFEGAAITAPNVSKNFTLDTDFKQTLFTMMEDLKSIYKQEGDNMAEENINKVFDETEGNSVEEPVVENQDNIESQVDPTFADKEDGEKKDDQKDDESTDDKSASDESDDKASEDASDEQAPPQDDEDKDKEDKKSASKNSLHTDEEYAELEIKFSNLQVEYDAMKAQVEKLAEYKNTIEDREKDALIAEFYMLSDEDKQDVIDHKREYSLDEIDAKLSVICRHNKVNFAVDTDNVQVDVNNLGNSTPEWVSAVMAVEKDI